MCGKHYIRYNRHGDPLVVKQRVYTTRPGGPCSIAECERRAVVRTWCRVHYDHWLRLGDPLASKVRKPYPRRPAIDRFTAMVEIGDCWLWTGYLNPNGYATFDRTRAHRWIWEYLVGLIPQGLELDHLCRVRHCVNPDHLEPVPHAVNIARKWGARVEYHWVQEFA